MTVATLSSKSQIVQLEPRCWIGRQRPCARVCGPETSVFDPTHTRQWNTYSEFSTDSASGEVVPSDLDSLGRKHGALDTDTGLVVAERARALLAQEIREEETFEFEKIFRAKDAEHIQRVVRKSDIVVRGVIRDGEVTGLPAPVIAQAVSNTVLARLADTDIDEAGRLEGVRNSNAPEEDEVESHDAMYEPERHVRERMDLEETDGSQL